MSHPYPPVDTGHPKYRPDIDGLRAVAVLSVVIYHAFPHALRGGFVGVDIFFVISGFLISRILIGGLESGTFSFGDFYVRRIRRIFPALILVLSVCALVGWFVLMPSDYRLLGKHILGGAGFVSNLVLWRESGYFDAAAELKPLLHLWSLGVEEQFYFVWPLGLWLAWKARFNLLALTATLIAVSFAFNLWMMGVDATGAFYSPATRFWELLCGALLAQVRVGDQADTSSWLQAHRAAIANAASFLGIGFIAAAIAMLDKTMAFPGWLAAAPVAGACLVIAAGPQALVNRVLSITPMVFVGLISYPLYLWHWPILAFAHTRGADFGHLQTGLVLVALSVLLAWGTYRLVERPLRFGHKPRYVWVLASLMAVAGVAGGVTFAKDGFEARYTEDLGRYANFQYDYHIDARRDTCWLNDQAPADGFAPECVAAHDDRPQLVLWGDSHAARLYPGMKAMIDDRVDLTQFTRDACPPFAEMAYPNCLAGNAYVLERIRSIRPASVILFGYWTHHMAGDRNAAVTQLDKTIASLKSAGVRDVIVLGPAPQWTTTLPNSLVQQVRSQGLERIPRRTTFGLEPAARDLDRFLEKHFKGRQDARYYSVWRAMCDQAGCLARTADSADSLTSWDYGHLTTAGARYVAGELLLEFNSFRAN